MYITIEPHDRVIVQYTERDVKVVYNEDEDVYYLVWRREADQQYQLMWRGTFDTCMKQFTEIVGDIDIDVQVERNEKRRAEAATR